MGGCTSKDKTVAENEGCVKYFFFCCFFLFFLLPLSPHFSSPHFRNIKSTLFILFGWQKSGWRMKFSASVLSGRLWTRDCWIFMCVNSAVCVCTEFVFFLCRNILTCVRKFLHDAMNAWFCFFFAQICEEKVLFC